MLHIAGPASDFFLTQSPDAQQEILQALRTIEAHPLTGEYLPFPWMSGILGYSTAQYFITYRLTDGVPEVAGITTMPTAADIQRALRERRRSR
jgi:hypothetical protein